MMNVFPDPLRLELQQHQKWRLLAPLSFMDPVHGRLTLPAGFATDLASIRTVRSVAVVGWLLAVLLQLLPWAWMAQTSALVGLLALALYAAVAGYGHAAAALHDGLYRAAELNRWQCDAVFYRALRAEGVARWRAGLMWAGVRLGGWRRYGRSG